LDRLHDASRRALAPGTGKLPDVTTGYNWELYHIAEDYSQYSDLAAKIPDKLKQMQALFLRKPQNIRSCPWTTRLQAPADATPSAVAGKNEFHLLG